MSEVNLKTRKIGPLIAAAALIVLLGTGFFMWNFISRQYAPVDPDDKMVVDVVIPLESSARQIAVLLKENNLIHSETAFLSYCKKMGYDSRLKAGHYRFSRSQTLAAIAEHIANGRVVNISFTIPEGYTLEQIKKLVIEEKICTEDQWKAAINKEYDYPFMQAIPAHKKDRLEGFLFPDTYSMSEDCTIEQLIDLMLGNFDQVWKQQLASQAQAQKQNIYETVILASLIEKEAQVAAERPIISGVIANRLKAGMLLQIDASVLYALQEHKDNVSYADLEVDSPFNTYKYPGLPPGPIACPGKAALEAALNPARHSYYYYVYKGDGTHYFSRTYSEHLAAKRKYGI